MAYTAALAKPLLIKCGAEHETGIDGSERPMRRRCANVIRAGLHQNNQVRDVVVDVPAGQVTVEVEADRYPGGIDTVLIALGHPEKTR